MASAPILISQEQMGGPQSVPRRSSGEDLYQAEVAGIRTLTQAKIAGARALQDIGMSGARDVANLEIFGAQQTAQAEIAGARSVAAAAIAGAQGIAGAEASAAASIGAAEREGVQAEGAASRLITHAAMQSSAAEVQFNLNLNRAANSVADTVLSAQRRTSLTEAKTSYLTGLEKIRAEFEKDQDWKNSPTRYVERHKQLEEEAFKGFSSDEIVELRQDTLRATQSVEREIRQRTVSKTQDAALAARDGATPQMLLQVSRAGSPQERAGLYAAFDKGEDDLVRDGMQSAQQAVQKKAAFRANVDQADVMRAIRDRPSEVMKALDDPSMFPTVDPPARERYKAQAQAALDERLKLDAESKAQRDPVSAAATWIRNPSPDQVVQIFDRGFITVESGGNPNAVGPKTRYGSNALGLSQIMPGTAREMARKLGMNDVADLPDGVLKELLISDPKLNRQLGLAYFRQNLAAYDGSVPAAIASYHAGTNSPAVRRAYEAARAQYGENFSAEQFVSFLPDSLNDGAPGREGTRTSDYVRKVYSALGADPSRGGASNTAAYRIGNSVQSVIDGEKAENLRQLKGLVAVTDDDRDAVLKAFKSGFVTSPEAVQAVKTPLIALAATGDAGAAQKLRQFHELEQAAPIVREAYQMPPEQLEAAVSFMRQAVAQGGSSAPEQRRLQIFETVAQEVATQRVQNPVGLIERSGAAPVTRIATPQDVSDPVFAAQLAQRAPVAMVAQGRFGGEVKVLKPQEEVALKARFNEAQPGEKAQLLLAAARAMPQDAAYRSFVSQVVGNDSVARTAGILGRSQPTIAEPILRGQVLLEQPGVKPKVAEVRAELQAKLPSNVYPAEVQGDLIEAALAVYAAERQASGSLFDRSDRAGLDRAIEKVAGTMVKVNGRYSPVPFGTPTRELTDGWRNLDADAINRAGGMVSYDGKPFDPAFLARNAILKPAAFGGGLYSVHVPQGGTDKPVLDLEGRPALVDLDSMRAVMARRQAVTDRATIRRDPNFSPAAAGARQVPQ